VLLDVRRPLEAGTGVLDGRDLFGAAAGALEERFPLAAGTGATEERFFLEAGTAGVTEERRVLGGGSAFDFRCCFFAADFLRAAKTMAMHAASGPAQQPRSARK